MSAREVQCTALCATGMHSWNQCHFLVGKHSGYVKALKSSRRMSTTCRRSISRFESCQNMSSQMLLKATPSPLFIIMYGDPTRPLLSTLTLWWMIQARMSPHVLHRNDPARHRLVTARRRRPKRRFLGFLRLYYTGHVDGDSGCNDSGRGECWRV